LYVNGGVQPVLVVNDLKDGDGKGDLALWIGMGTEAYFADLRVGSELEAAAAKAAGPAKVVGSAGRDYRRGSMRL
jgi:hypothetical protein